MDTGKILLVNLSRGRTGDLNSKLLGMIFVMKFEAAAMSRADIPEEYRKDFCLYVDEFQNFSTESFADILSQARKYHLNLIVANQFSTQLSEEVRDAVFGNVGSVVCFRVGTNDAEFLTKQFAPVFDIDDLQFLPNFNTAVRMMIGGVPVQPFSMATLPTLGSPNSQLSEALKQLSAAKYGRPKAVVENEIFKRMATSPAPVSINSVTEKRLLPNANITSKPPSFNPSASARKIPSNQSFLDEWLTKRKQTTRQSAPNSAMPLSSSPVPSTNGASYQNDPNPALNSPKENQKPEEFGELKIRGHTDSVNSNQDQVKTLHIDRDGNLHY
jgi:hypothetical protein